MKHFKLHRPFVLFSFCNLIILRPIIRVKPNTEPFIQLIQRSHLVRCKLKIKHINISLYMLFVLGFRNHNKSVLYIPSKNYLRYRFAMAFCNLLENVVTQQLRMHPCKWCIRHNLNIMDATEFCYLLLLKKRMNLNLINYRYLICFTEKFFQVVDIKITDTNTFYKFLIIQ